MKLIVVLESIVTIILVTMPVFKSIRMSADERKAESLQASGLILNVVGDYAYYLTFREMSLFEEFVFNEGKMREFAEYLIENRHIPEWSKSYRLKNPKLFKLLRFEQYVNPIPSGTTEMIERLINFKNEIFQNSPQVSVENVCFKYLADHLIELISLENYFTLRVLEKDYKQVELKNPLGWRIGQALYSLALRQYRQNFISTFSPIICYSQHLLKASQINDTVEGETFKAKTFWFCSSKNSLPEKLSSSSIADLNDSSLYWTLFEHEITDPNLIVNLQDIIPRDDGDLYCFLPEIKFEIVSSPEIYETAHGFEAVLKLKTLPKRGTSKWLVKMANNIEKYKKKELKYFQKHFDLNEDNNFISSEFSL